MRCFAPLLAVGGLLVTTPVLAQYADSQSALRAINLARNTAIKLNGGLGVYRPAKCMFEPASESNPCLIANDSDGFTFRFLGGGPGWQVLNKDPSIETEIRITPDGRTVNQVVFNKNLR
ncbi:MAG: hypothetical protein ACKO7Z_09575 [Cyanobacteriota bacterium]